MSGISLTSSMRSNLLSLQQTAKLQDLTQNRIATGLKVNSAIDNPSSFYTAQSLNNRAEDLNILLDAMSQGIQTLKAVNESIEAGTKFLEQAKSVANSALETTQPIAARVTNEAELLAAVASGKSGLIVLENDITMSENQSIKLHSGQSLVGARYLDKNAAQTTLNANFKDVSGDFITLAEDSTIADLNIIYKNNVKKNKTGIITVDENLTGIRIHNVNLTINLAGIDSLDDNEFGAIYVKNGAEVELSGVINIFDTGAPDYARRVYGIWGDGRVSLYGETEFNIETKSMLGHGTLANINIYDNASLNIVTNGIQAFPIIGDYSARYDYGHLNLHSANAKIYLQKNFDPDIFYSSDNDTGNTVISAVKGAQIIIADKVFTANQDFDRLLVKSGSDPNISRDGDKDNMFDESEAAQETQDYYQDLFDDLPGYMNNVPAAPLPKEVDVSDERFNQILDQYEKLINDSWYKGVNLLKGQDLKVVFNESRTSDLDIKGVDATSKSLGLETADWSNAAGVQTSLNQLDSAINQLRLYASEFGNYYQIVTTRENFTNSLINVLTEGADALTLADMNQESANMLALQTRQQLAVNSLSLASQARQSVLKLF